MARVAAMSRARDLVRDVPPPSAEAREQGLAAALAAFDPDVGVGGWLRAGRGGRLAARRRARAQRTRWLGAAVVVLALVASVAGLAALAGDSRDDSESVALQDSGSGTSADESGDDGAAQDAPAEEGETSAESAAGAAPAPDVGDLGSFPDAEALAAAACVPRPVAASCPGAAQTPTAHSRRCPAARPSRCSTCWGTERPPSCCRAPPTSTAPR